MARTREVALVIGTNNHFNRSIVTGIGRYSRKAGHWVTYVEDEPALKVPDFRTWTGHGIIADLDDIRVARAVSRMKIPVVGLGGFSDATVLDVNVPYVATDDDAIGRMGAEHLMGRGLRNFAYCGVPRTRCNTWSRWRGRAFAARLREAGFRCATHIGARRTPRQWTRLLTELADWVRSLPRPVGIMACDDARARHVSEACFRLGLRVPDDVAILGVDNNELMCEMSRVPLSSVEQDPVGIGYSAAALLDRIMRGARRVPRWTVVPPVRIVTRRSTDVIAVDQPQVAAAMAFIREHIDRRLRASDVTDHVMLCRTSLDLQFKAALGTTIHQFIARCQLEKAQRLLHTTDWPLKVIAGRCGYVDLQYMSAIFRKRLETTPGRLRRRRYSTGPV